MDKLILSFSLSFPFHFTLNAKKKIIFEPEKVLPSLQKCMRKKHLFHTRTAQAQWEGCSCDHPCSIEKESSMARNSEVPGVIGAAGNRMMKKKKKCIQSFQLSLAEDEYSFNPASFLFLSYSEPARDYASEILRGTDGALGEEKVSVYIYPWGTQFLSFRKHLFLLLQILSSLSLKDLLKQWYWFGLRKFFFHLFCCLRD